MNQSLGPLACDQHARTQALDPDVSLIIQAPAGSGKTELLIQRYLRLLVTVPRCDMVLAVTFTKKAAGEMRARIVHALESAQQHPLPTQPHAQLTWRLAKQVLEHGHQQQWPLTDLSNHLSIMTIDACCQHFLSLADTPFQLYAHYQLHPQPASFYRDVIQQFIHTYCLHDTARYYDDFHQLLMHYHHDYRAVEQLMTTALSHREKWIRLTLTTRTTDFISQFAGSVAHCQQAHIARLLDVFTEDQICLVEQTFTTLQSLNALINLPSDIDILASRPVLDWTITDWQCFVQLLRTQGGQWRQRFTQQHGIANQASLKQLDASQQSQYADAKSSLKSLISSCQTTETLASVLIETSWIPVVDDPEAEWACLEPLLNILPALVAFLHLRMDVDQVSDFSGINLQLLSTLSDDTSSQPLILRIYQRYRHVLIDEFQDTSVHQFEIFERAFSSWQDESQRTLCVVGDPMQSIYRFRQAEVKLFYQAKNDGFCGVPLKHLQLTRNFRSTNQLVDVLNPIFKAVMSPDHNPFFPAKPVLSAKEGGCYWHQVNPDLSQAQVLCQTIAQLQKQYSDQTICLLVRSRTQLRYILPALERQGIDYQGVGLHALGQSQSVLDLFSMTCILLDAFDRLSWVSFLNAPAVAFPMDDIQQVCQDKHAAVWDSLQRMSASLSTPAQQITARITPLVEDALKQVGRIALSQIVQRLWHRLGADLTAPSAAEYEHCLQFLTRLRELEHAHIPITRERLQQLLPTYPERAQSPDPSRLTVMTIHKSKGLEYDIVLIPYLEQSTPISDKALLDWTYVSHRSQQHLLLHTHLRHRRQATTVHRYLRHVDKQGQLAEMERLYYVGFTRAKSQLHLFSAEKSGYNERSIMRLLAAALSTYLPPSHQVKHEHISADEPIARKRTDQRYILPPNWQHPYAVHWQSSQTSQPHALAIKPVSVVDIFDDHSGRTRWGEMIHMSMAYLLSQNENPHMTADKIRQYVAFFGIDVDRDEMVIDTLLHGFHCCIEDPRFQWMWQHRHTGSVEANLATQGQIQRADYTFEADGIRWIIDFKTHHIQKFLDTGQCDHPSSVQADYRDQLLRYQSAYRALNRHQPIRCALYYPLSQTYLELSPLAEDNLVTLN